MTVAHPSAPTPSQGLLHSLLQQLRQGARERRAEADATRGVVIAFSSASSGEGVTHTVTTLLEELGRDRAARTARVVAASLRGLDVEPAGLRASLLARCHPLAGGVEGALWELAGDSTSPDGACPWDSSWEFRRLTLEHLRGLFDCVLLDCPALGSSNDVLAVAPFVDGVMLVVQANRTRQEQILHAQRSIEFARGKVLGHILNKRSYAVPDWLYRHL